MAGMSWHARLYCFGAAACPGTRDRDPDVLAYAAIVSGAAAFLAGAAAICIVLNLATLPFGVFVEPIWREDARFRRLKFPGGIPVISVALPILLAFAAWKNWQAAGPLMTVGPFVLVFVLGLSLLGALVMFNKARGRLPRVDLQGAAKPENVRLPPAGTALRP